MALQIYLTTSKLLTLPLTAPEQPAPAAPSLASCSLKWRHKKLWVKRLETQSAAPLPALQNEQWLRDCLQRSPVNSVCLDASLGEAEIKFWADACAQAKKQVMLRIPSHQKTLSKQRLLRWQIKRLMDWSAAVLLLLVLSPILLCLGLLIKGSSPGPIFYRQWRVGKRGKLFRIFKFRTMVADAEQHHHTIMGAQAGLHKREDDPRITAVGRWLRKYSLDELPQLFNVLRGEMSLVGPRPWALYDALRISPRQRKRLNALPGITGAWQVEARSKLLDLDAVTHRDLEYLYQWSLGKDLNILLLTIPRVISGFGAH